MTPTEWIEMTDGGTTVEVPDMESKMVNPEEITVDPMNERRDQPLDLEDLEESVAQVGVVEDPVCRVIDEGAKVKYGVIQGQRRVLAAQNMQLDKIRISIGDFDDLTALKRSITENISSTKQDVSNQARALAVQTMWELMDHDSDNEIPDTYKIADELGVDWNTADRYIEPLREQWKGTVVDPNVNIEEHPLEGDVSVELDNVSPQKLQLINRMTTMDSPEQAEELLLETVDSEFTVNDYKEMAKLRSSGEDIEQAFETVKQSKQAAQEAKAYTLNMMRFGGTTGGAIRKAARATGKDEKVVVKDAVGYYLREEGYL